MGDAGEGLIDAEDRLQQWVADREQQKQRKGVAAADPERERKLSSLRLARYFGIYGNTVIVDHGLGLMSLSAHLSSIDVKQGQSVERGDPVGLSGATGLAGGDHLHFTTLVRGLPVNPIEWWDAHWIRDRITSKLP